MVTDTAQCSTSCTSALYTVQCTGLHHHYFYFQNLTFFAVTMLILICKVLPQTVYVMMRWMHCHRYSFVFNFHKVPYPVSAAGVWLLFALCKTRRRSSLLSNAISLLFGHVCLCECLLLSVSGKAVVVFSSRKDCLWIQNIVHAAMTILMMKDF